MSKESTLFGQILWGTKPQAHHLDAISVEEYETDLLKVDIKPEIYAQTVYSTSQNPHGVALGRKLFSPLELGVTKDLDKSIVAVRYYLHMNHTTIRNCSVVDHSWAEIRNYPTNSKATLLTYDNSELKPMGKRKATSSFWLRLCKAGTG